jgi:CubicO group peptidase (beta-lactamase class C family)
MFTYLFTFSQSTATFESDKINEYIEAVKNEYNIPGIVVAISDENGIKYLESFGNVSKDDLFQIGSLSKSFTGLLILKLHEQGLINLDDPVVKYLDWFEYKNKIVSDKITIRNLLYQTSGLTTKMGEDFLKKGSENTRINLSNKLKKFELETTDPNIFRYSNLNYRLLGYIIEDVTKKSYGNVLKEEITKPFSMNSTTGFVTDNFVQGFQYFLYYPLVPISINYHKDDIPSGYIGSTASDMSPYLTELMNSYNGKENTVIDQKTTLSLFEPDASKKSYYAMGWITMTRDNTKIFFHDGATESFSTQMIIAPEINKNIIILTNAFGHNNYEIGFGILNILLNKKIIKQSQTSFSFTRSIPILVLILIIILVVVIIKWINLQEPILFSKHILPNIILTIGLGIGIFLVVVVPSFYDATLKNVIEFDRISGYSLILLCILIIFISLLTYFIHTKKTLPNNGS